MKAIKLHIEIKKQDAKQVYCFISDKQQQNHLQYGLEDGHFIFEEENHLSSLLRENKIQFEKVIRTAIRGKLAMGHRIQAVFLEGFKFLKDQDFYDYIRVDRRGGGLALSVSKEGHRNWPKIYADGSFSQEAQRSGYGGFTEDVEGHQEIFFRSYAGGSSNLIELKAIIEGLQRMQDQACFQVFTDSRYVIRGLVQWTHFWRYNDWQTAFGTSVKYSKAWQQAYELCEGHCIEFKWVKGHSGDLKQDFCHQLAKELTGNGGR